MEVMDGWVGGNWGKMDEYLYLSKIKKGGMMLPFLIISDEE
jgi:hypothetical protein